MLLKSVWTLQLKTCQSWRERQWFFLTTQVLLGVHLLQNMVDVQLLKLTTCLQFWLQKLQKRVMLVSLVTDLLLLQFQREMVPLRRLSFWQITRVVMLVVVLKMVSGCSLKMLFLRKKFMTTSSSSQTSRQEQVDFMV